MKAKALARTMLYGAGLGIAIVVVGTLWYGLGQRTPVDGHELATETAIGAVGGATMGVVLHLTKSFRVRGRVQYYCSWMLACFVAVLVVTFPELLRDGWWAVEVSLFFGFVGGLGLGTFMRPLKGHRW